MVAIADLNLVGAVGIRVRPDATGFKREAKAEVMSQLQGLDGQVPVTPQVEGSRSELEAAIRRLTQGLGAVAKVKVAVDKDVAERDIARVERSLKDLQDVRLEVNTNTAAAEASIKRLDDRVEGLVESYDALNKAKLSDIERATNQLHKAQEAMADQVEKVYETERELARLRDSVATADRKSMAARERALLKLAEASDVVAEAEKRLADARKRADDLGTAQAARAAENAVKRLAKAREKQADAEAKLAEANAAMERSALEGEAKRQDSIKKTTKLLEEQWQELDRLGDEGEDVARALARHQATLNKFEGRYTQAILKSNEGHQERKSLLELQLKEEARRLQIAEQIAAIENASTSELQGMLEAQARDGQTLSDVLDDILWRAKRLDDVEFKNLRDFVAGNFAKSSVAHLRVEADTAMAEAELAALERSRWVRLKVRVDSKVGELREALAAIEKTKLPKGIQSEIDGWTSAFSGFAKATTGLSSISMMNNILKTSMANMHGLSLSAAAASTAIGGLSAVAVSSLAGLASLAKGLVDIGKGGVMLPSLLLGIGMGFGAAKRGVSEFIAAASGNEEAMESLAKSSERAAEAAGELFQLFSEADSRGKSTFFKNLEDQASRLSETLQPMAALWEASYDAAGRFFDGVIKGVNEWFDSGEMHKSVDRIAEALKIASGAGENFTNILTDMTDVGSKYLPDMAKALEQASRSWRDFIRASKDNGDMDRWIKEAARQLQGLGRTASGAIGIIDALGRAANRAGYDGFVSLGNMAQAAAEKLNTPLWQKGLTDLFKGAGDGAKAAGDGIKFLLDRVMQASEPLGDLMRTSGRTIGELNKLTGAAITNSRALEGFSELGRDIQEAFEGADGLFIALGDAMGDSARVAGEVFKAFMRVAEATATFWADSRELTRGLEQAIPVLADFAVKLVNITHALAGPLLDGLGILLQTFAGLPGAAQQAIVAIGALGAALLILRSRANNGVLSGFISSIPGIGRVVNGAVTSLDMFGRAVHKTERGFASFRNGWVVATGALANDGNLNEAKRKVGDLDNRMGRLGGGFGLAVGTISSGFQTIRGDADDSRSKIERFREGMSQIGQGAAIGGINTAKSALNGLKGAATSAMNALGGPWGLAIMAATAIIGHFAAKTAEAKQKVTDIQGTLSATGDATTQTAKAITDNLNGVWDKFSVGWNNSILNWSRRIGEVAEMTGKSSAELAKGIAEGSEEFEKYRANLENAAQITTAFSGSSGVARDAMGKLTDEQKALGKQLGINGPLTAEQAEALGLAATAAGLEGQEIQGLVDELNAEVDARVQAKKQQEEYARAMGLTTTEGQKLSAAMQVLGDETADVASKTKAHAEALDVMSGGTRSFLQSTQQQAQSMGQLSDAFKQVREAGISGSEVFVEYTNKLGKASSRVNTARSELAGLDSAIQSSFDSTTNHAQAVYDATLTQTGSMTLAAQAANDVMSQWRSQAQAELVAMGADAQQAQQYLNDIAGEPYMAEVIFMGKTEHFMEARKLVEDAGKQFDGEAFTAFLRANPGTTKEDIKALIDAGVTWSSSKYSAILAVDGSDAQAKIDEIVARGEEFDGEEFEAAMKGDDSHFLDAVIAAKMSGEEFGSKEWRARFGLNDEEYQRVYNQAVQQGETIGSKEWVARLDMSNPGFAEKFYASEASMKGLTGEDWKVYLESNVGEVQSEQDKLYGSLTTLNGTVSTVSVVSNALTEAMALEFYKLLLDGMDGKEIQQTLKLSDEEFLAVADAIPGKHDELTSHIRNNPAEIKAEDKTDEAITSAKGKLETTTKGPWVAPLGANDETAEGLASADFALKNYANTPATADAKAKNATDEGISEAKASMESKWKDVEFKAKADVDDTLAKTKLGSLTTEGSALNTTTFKPTLDAEKLPADTAINSVKTSGATLNTTTFKATLDGNAQPFETSKGLAITSGLGFGASLFAAALGGNKQPFETAKGEASASGQAFQGTTYASKLDASQNQLALSLNQARIAAGAFAAMKFSTDLNATTGGVSAGVTSARGMGMGFQGTTFTSALSGNSALMRANTGAARGIGMGFQGTTFTSSLSGNSALMRTNTSTARGIGAGFQNTTFTSRLSGNSGAFNSTVGSARGTGQSFANSNFRSTISARDGATGTINYLFGRAWSWAGRVFTATFRAVSQKLGFADGGFVKNGMRVFANGGFIPQMNVQRFAQGGARSGRHAPQIRYPQGPNITVWNEGAGRGNTAGESYIPHAIGKRSRSTQILGLTAREFGLSVVKYGDGGITHIGGQEAPATMGAYAPQPGVSTTALARGVRSGLAGTQLTIGRGGEVSFAMAAERGQLRAERR